MPLTMQAGAVRAAVRAAAELDLDCTDPVVLADGANVIVHLSPSPVVAKVAASTAVIRPDVAGWLQRELDLALFLAGAGAPVLAPSPELPAAVYRADGQVMSFWRYVSPAGDATADEATIGSMLRDLHHLLRPHQAALPVLAPLQDIPAFLARPQIQLTARDRAAVSAAYTRLTAELDAASPGQVLHGDAGAGNLMATGHGWVWHDFEDTCYGPVTWDLAASTASQWQDRSRILAAYKDPIDPDQLDVCEQLRRLNLTVWYSLYAERLPQLQGRAAELLASWPAP
jgi:Ser/Thr protein kinase RdoA (MazF antagonist)